jgi:hypothetical protein
MKGVELVDNENHAVMPKDMERAIENRALEYRAFSQAIKNAVDDGSDDYKRRYRQLEDEVFRAKNAVEYYCCKYGLDIKKYINK